MVPLNLAPNLPDSLRLPRNLGRWNGATVDVRFITMELLVAFGLNYIEANLLFYRVLQLKDSPEPRFDAVPQDPNLPATKTGNSQSPVAAISGRDKCFVFPFKEVDRPEFGIFSFSAVIQLATSKKEALKTFSEWYDKQRAALGIGNWKQPGRDPIRFLRDLIVYEFSGYIIICLSLGQRTADAMAVSIVDPNTIADSVHHLHKFQKARSLNVSARIAGINKCAAMDPSLTLTSRDLA